MRTIFSVALLVLAGLHPPQQQAGTGTIRGIVTVAESGQPLKDAQVTLRRLEPSIASGSPAIPGVTTDDHGNFEFQQVTAGEYAVTVRRSGYVSLRPFDGVASANATDRTRVEAGRAASLDIFMNQGGSIRGRVTAADGTAASGVRVLPFMFTYRNGRREITFVSQTQTDANGRYQIQLIGPGEYIIGVQRPIQPRAGATPLPDWVPTFFPNALDPLSAAVVLIKGGEQRSDLDIRLQSVKSFSIRGRAFNPLPQPSPRFLPNGERDLSISSFMLIPRGAPIVETLSAQIPNAITTVSGHGNGDFEIRNVAPGLYDLFPVAPIVVDGETRYASSRTTVEIRDHDVDGITLTLNPGVDIQGRIRIDGKPNGVKLDALRVRLEPHDDTPIHVADAIRPQQVGADGSFRIRYVAEARYDLVIEGLSDNTYVQEIRSGRKSVFDTGLSVGKTPPSPVEIVLNTNGRTLEGTVINQKRPRSVVVVLVPEKAHRQNASLYRGAISETDGHFKVSAIPPGNYRIFAWENVLSGAWQNTEFMARYEKFGKDLHVRSKTISDLKIPVIDSDQ